MKKIILNSILALCGIALIGLNDANAKELTNDSSGKDVYVEVSASCKGHGGSLCSCTTFKGYKKAGSNRYYGRCQNRANGHVCGHSASEHGL